MFNPNALLSSCAIRGQPNRILRLFNSMMASMSACEGPLGPGFPFLHAVYSNRYLRFLSMSWKFKSVEGLRMTAAY